MAISYNRLGSNGRLGNQMFQYAGLRGIAKQHGYSWLIPPPDDYGDSNYGLFDCFEMSTVTLQNFGYLSTDQNIATGCFHFKEILDPCKEVVDQFDNPIFIHVRRGDYVNQPDNHPVCPISYYEKALKEFPDDVPVFVFSDDLDWCREQFTDDRFVLPTENIKYSHTADTNDGRVQSFVPYYDLCMMSLCSGAIIANSSMSWWGAWLQDGRGKVVAPKPWFGSNYKNYDMSDLLPESWIEMEV